MAFSDILTIEVRCVTLILYLRPSVVDIEFADSKLALVETEDAHKTKLPVAVIDSMRNKLGFIRGAPDERSLRNWRSLHYEKMEGEERSIRLNDQYRLIFRIDTTCSPNKITVLRIWDHN